MVAAMAFRGSVVVVLSIDSLDFLDICRIMGDRGQAPCGDRIREMWGRGSAPVGC